MCHYCYNDSALCKKNPPTLETLKRNPQTIISKPQSPNPNSQDRQGQVRGYETNCCRAGIGVLGIWEGFRVTCWGLVGSKAIHGIGSIRGLYSTYYSLLSASKVKEGWAMLAVKGWGCHGRLVGDMGESRLCSLKP